MNQSMNSLAASGCGALSGIPVAIKDIIATADMPTTIWEQKLAPDGTTLLGSAHQIAAATQPLPITDREREISAMVSAGMSNREIADRLSVSVRTVDGHLYRIYAKLDIQSRDQLARLIRPAESGA